MITSFTWISYEKLSCLVHFLYDQDALLDKHKADDTFGDQFLQDSGRPLKSLVVITMAKERLPVLIVSPVMVFSHLLFGLNSGCCRVGGYQCSGSDEISTLVTSSVLMERHCILSCSIRTYYSSHASNDTIQSVRALNPC